MAQHLPSTPHPNLVDMRRAYETKISLGLCSYFFVCRIGGSEESYGSTFVRTQEPLVTASAE